ncbi:MAG: GNAT family N-acetyltransferase [Cyclobacteriaceae bacterium]
MTVRPCTTGDFKSILHFLNELQGKTFDPELLQPMFEKNISNPANIYLVAEHYNQVVGYLSCHVQLLLHHAGLVGEVQEIFVLKEFRGKGAGKLLIDELKEIVKTRGAVQLEVTTRAIRERAIKFYKREKFEDSHKKLVYYL